MVNLDLKYRSSTLQCNHNGLNFLFQSACDFCQLLNSNEASRYSSYDNLRTWWYSIGSLREKCLPYIYEMKFHEHLEKKDLRSDDRWRGLQNVSKLLKLTL